MLASLKPTGRMGVVLDQGALFRGGAEGKIRQKIRRRDLIECVVALPEKMFYNTGAPGCLIFLEQEQAAGKKGKVLFIYAGKVFEKLKNMNRFRDEDIERIVETYQKFEDHRSMPSSPLSTRYRENDYNLSVTRYVDVFEQDEQIDVSQTGRNSRALEAERQAIDEKLSTYLRELGYER